MKIFGYFLLFLVISCTEYKMSIETFESGFSPKNRTYFLINEATSLEDKYYQNLLEIILREAGMKKVFSKENADYSINYKYTLGDHSNKYNSYCNQYGCSTSQKRLFQRDIYLKAFNKKGEEVYSTWVASVGETGRLYDVSQCMFEALRRAFPSRSGVREVELTSSDCKVYFKYNLLSEEEKKDILKSDYLTYEMEGWFETQKRKRKKLEEEFYGDVSSK